MRKLFRSFERSGLEYLLISGQASIVYGAATFSEDIDLWIRPSEDNARRFLKALASCGARVHKLTPRLTLRNMNMGHGFHFVIPARPVSVYLDVMGVPPRVGPFREARGRAESFETKWGRLPVVSIEDLIALKKTKRLYDYEVISNLVALRLAREPAPSRKLLAWAAATTFRAEDRVQFLNRLGKKSSVETTRDEILQRLARLQSLDSRYWRKVIRELRRLRRRGALWPEGTRVSDLA